MAAVHLFSILPSSFDKTNQSIGEYVIWISPTDFDTTLLSSRYVWVIAAAMLQSKVADIAKLQPFR